VVKQAIDILPTLTNNFEVLVIDDGSQDRTVEIVKGLSGQNSKVKLISHPVNRGYGAAVATGLMSGTKEWVFFTDGDGQFNLAELPLLWELRKDFDVVLGYRLKRNDPLIRTVNSWLWKILIRFLFNLNVKDLNCAFKLFRSRDIQALNLKSEGAFITVELLVKLKKIGLGFGEVGVHHYPRTAGRQTGANLRVIFKAFKELFVLWRNLM